MFSWFTSPALDTVQESNAEEEAHTRRAESLRVTPGFHPIELPPSPTDRAVSVPAAQLIPSTRYATDVEAPSPLSASTAAGAVDSNNLFGGLDLAPRVARRRPRVRRSPTMDDGAELPNASRSADVPPADSASPPRSSAFSFLPVTLPEESREKVVTPAVTGPTPPPSQPESSPLSASALQASEGTHDEARMRRRLERFYREYNPGKLPDVDATVRRFGSRETELFAALEKKYGPEPASLETGALTGARAAHRTSADKHTTSESGASAFSFLKSTADTRASGAETEVEGSPEPTSAHRSAPGLDGEQKTSEQTSLLSNNHTAEELPATQASEASTSALGAHQSALGEEHRTMPMTPTRGSVPSATVAADEGQRADPNAEAEEDVLQAIKRLTSAIRAIAELLAAHRAEVATVRRLDAEVVTCIASEDYERAQELTRQSTACSARVVKIDEDIASRARPLRALRRDLEKRMIHLADVLRCTKEKKEKETLTEAARWTATLAEIDVQLQASEDLQNEILAAADTERKECHQALDTLEDEQRQVKDAMLASTADIRQQQEETKDRLADIESEISALEARLRTLHQRRTEEQNTMQALSAQISVTERAHEAELDNIARKVAAAEDREATVEEQVSEALRQASETQKTLQRKRDEAVLAAERANASCSDTEALASRARLLEEEDIPLMSTLTDTLVTALERRQRDGEILLRLALQTSDKAAEEGGLPKDTQLAELESKAVMLEGRHRGLLVALQNLRESLPVLEAAKAAAVVAKHFKVAQEKMNELKAARASITELETELAALEQEREATHDELARSRAGWAAQARAAQHRATAFVRECERDCEAAMKLLQTEGSERSDTYFFGASLKDAFTTAWEALSEELAAIQTAVPGDVEVDGNQDSLEPTREDDGLPPLDSPSGIQDELTEAPPRDKPAIEAPTREALEKALADAVEQENYEECDRIQSALDALTQ